MPKVFLKSGGDLVELPTPLDTTAAPIQPFSAFLANAWKFADGTQPLDAHGQNITYLDPALIAANARLQAAQRSGAVNIDLSVNPGLTQAVVDGTLVALDATGISGITLLIDGPAPTIVRAGVASVATVVGASINGGSNATADFHDSDHAWEVFGNNTLPLASSALHEGTRALEIGVSDFPDGAAIASTIGALLFFEFDLSPYGRGSVSASDNGDGTVTITFSGDDNAAHFPLNFTNATEVQVGQPTLFIPALASLQGKSATIITQAA